MIVFGGLLLLGGRLSDLFGARRLFMLGFAVLTAGSFVAGLATSQEVLLSGRAFQGLGAALIAPSAMTILVGLFGHHGADAEEHTRRAARGSRRAPEGEGPAEYQLSEFGRAAEAALFLGCFHGHDR